MDADGVNATIAGCNATACNVVLGSVSAAMVVVSLITLVHSPARVLSPAERYCAGEFLLAVVREMRVHRPGQLRRLAPSAVQWRTLHLGTTCVQ
jgi:hypothetical protein